MATNILEFNGGKALSANAAVLNPQFSTRLSNVKISSVILESLKGPLDTSMAVDDSVYNFQDTWQSAVHADYIEYGNNLYYSRAGGVASKFNGVDTNRLGIEKPVGVPAVAEETGRVVSDTTGNRITGVVLTNRDIVDADIDVELSTYLSDNILVSTGEVPAGFEDGPQFYRVCLIDNGTIIHSRDVRIDIDASEGNLVGITLNNLAGHRIRIYRAIDGNAMYKFFSENLIVLDTEYFSDYGLDLADADDYVAPVAPDPDSEEPVEEVFSVVQYTVTYYNDDDGTESAPMELTPEFRTTPDKAVVLTNLPVSRDPQVTHKNIYRLGGEVTTLSRVAQVDAGTVEYRDLISNLDIGEVLDSVNNLPPGFGLIALTENYGVFFGMVDNELRYSEVGNPNYWPPQYSIRLRGEGTGLIPVSQGLLVFTTTCTYLLVGTNPNEFAITLLTDSQGCVSHRSCKLIRNFPLWLSYEGVCTLEGSAVKVISKPLLDTIRIPIHQAEVFDEQYYIVRTDGTINVLELKGSARFYDIKLLNEDGTIKKITGIRRYEDNLYFVINGSLHKAFAGEPLKLEYTSPVLTEGNHSTIKDYNKVYIRYRGQFTIKMHINEILVQTVTVDSETDATLDFQPPAAMQRGYSCRFDIDGVGRIYSIETLPKERLSNA